MANEDLVSWNAILSGYSQEGNHGLEAIFVFIEMVGEGMGLDNVPFTSAVSACGHEMNLKLGLTIKSGYESHVSVCNVLISTYSKCEVTEDAKLVLQCMNDRNVVSWTTMISIDEEDVISLFNEMRLDDALKTFLVATMESKPNNYTFGSVLSATVQSSKFKYSVLSLSLKLGFFSSISAAALIRFFLCFSAIEVTSDEHPRQFLSMPEEAQQMFGIGLHHAGLNDKDRSLVEEQDSGISVLPHTLAWGVNLPGHHLVIIKGTEYYDGKTTRYVDLSISITDILQMMVLMFNPAYYGLDNTEPEFDIKRIRTA
ncbi:hypothetical protein PRUPE_7G240300 [Prunus persica]|uniref:Pentatricopeptide repeat-containing protein n=1 Tax=Prunus persica TaxID=3760 RepID=A0A251NG37_PRUPE|nr:hypothetical protein PRUPE_7G240300 [Prunus persica]